jgi:hypothetical protein
VQDWGLKQALAKPNQPKLIRDFNVVSYDHRRNANRSFQFHCAYKGITGNEQVIPLPLFPIMAFGDRASDHKIIRQRYKPQGLYRSQDPAQRFTRH